jgi:nicotinamidase-related amidase
MANAPIRPEPVAVQLAPDSTAVLVLDLGASCERPAEPCHQLLRPVEAFLDRARQHAVPIAFTLTARSKGTDSGRVVTRLRQQPSEPVLFPMGYDKFHGGELGEFLHRSHASDLVILGSSTNLAVLYTATAALRMHNYRVVLPIDGVIARGEYEQEYSFHQLSVLTSLPPRALRFTQLASIEFLPR